MSDTKKVAPTMAESIEWHEQNIINCEIAAASFQDEDAKAAERYVLSASHSRNALTAMRAVSGEPVAWATRNRKSGVITGALLNKADLIVFHDEDTVPLCAFPTTPARDV